MRKYLPDKDYFIGKDIPGLPNYTIVTFIGSGNNAHVFKARNELIKRDIACKIVPIENLVGGDREYPSWRDEINKANTLSHEAVVKFWQVVEWKDQEKDIDCVALCSDLVIGQTLKKYISNSQNVVDVSFVEIFLKTMLDFFLDMKKNSMIHGDLHEGNILVADRSARLLGETFSFRITDFGVAQASYDFRLRDDYVQLAIILRHLLERIDYQQLSARDKFAFNILNDEFLAVHLSEKDPTRNHLAMDPERLFRRLEEIDDDFNKNRRLKATEAKLLTPFDYLSCEQIGESHNLLKALYSSKFLGLQDVESRSNLVLTGTRGCGKSTVFKCLSLKHRCLVEDDKPDDIKYIGIYYRCDDLNFAFPRYTLPGRQDAFNIPMHYLSATLICIILETIEMWATRYFPDEFQKMESRVAASTWECMKNIKKPGKPGVDNFKAIISRLQEERTRAKEKQRFIHDENEKIGYYFGPEIILEICELFINKFSFLGERPFYFFIDDYSIPKITNDLQRNLNRLLMQRTSVCFFKISTESPVSYSRSDIDGKEYVERREFILSNLALSYISAQRGEKLKFIEDIFARRFRSVEKYPVKTIDELIGDYKPPSSNSIAQVIREKGKPDEMHGKKILCQLCSGDIYYIIELVGKMVSKAGGSEKLSEIPEIPKIDKEIQRRAIKEEAGLFLENLRRIEGGERLVQVVTAFGNISYAYLKYKNSKNLAQKPPHQASRIEPMESLELSDEAKKVYTELLRYSLFIEDPRGKSIRGKVVPRLFLRKSLLPHFNLTFSTRDSVQLLLKEIEEFLLTPEEFERKKCSALEKQEESKDINEQPLFKNSKGE